MPQLFSLVQITPFKSAIAMKLRFPPSMSLSCNLPKVVPFHYKKVDDIFAERSTRILLILNKGKLAIV